MKRDTIVERLHAVFGPRISGHETLADAVLRLPVIATCGDCSHWGVPYWAKQKRVCLHGYADDVPPRDVAPERIGIDIDAPPPSWCPWRGKE